MGDKVVRNIEVVLAYLVIGGVIVGFLLTVLLGLPTKSYINKNAKTIKNLSSEFFNETLSRDVNDLSVPDKVPVSPDAGSVGRSNAFQRY